MKKLLILLFIVLCLVACEKYRVVEMEDGSFSVQVNFIGIYTNPIVHSIGPYKYFYCKNLNKEEACSLKIKFERLEKEIKNKRKLKE